MTLDIAVNTMAFSGVYSLLLRELPRRHSRRGKG
jgi:hypothetical protein